MRSKRCTILTAPRTSVREKSVDECCGCASSPWAESESSVADTCIDLLDVQRVMTIIRPAARIYSTFAFCGSAKADIIRPSSIPVAHLASAKASKPAIGTPIKFTKSLPAKARARAKVPARIFTRRILTLNSCKKKRISEQTAQQISSARSRLSFIQPINALSLRTFLRPLTSVRRTAWLLFLAAVATATGRELLWEKLPVNLLILR